MVHIHKKLVASFASDSMGGALTKCKWKRSECVSEKSGKSAFNVSDEGL